jgi:hypothetical protein
MEIESMKKLVLCLTCLTLLVCLAPVLHAEPAALSAQAFLASLSSNATPAAQAPADPLKLSPSDLFLPAPALTSCTVTVCERDCNDCPAPKHGYCISTQTCTCGCR